MKICAQMRKVMKAPSKLKIGFKFEILHQTRSNLKNKFELQQSHIQILIKVRFPIPDINQCLKKPADRNTTYSKV